MPLIKETPLTPPVQKPVAVKIAAPEFRGVTVDTRYDPATSLLTHIEGASWTVNYYSQVLGADNALSGQQIDRHAAYQQYKLIQRFELKVTTALNQPSQDSTTKSLTLVGQSNVYPVGLIPNEGDHFLADVGDGREGLFVVTNSEQRSIYRDTAYLIDYELVDYSEKDDRVDDLNSKVVENLYFNMDFLLHGQNPLISLESVQKIEMIQAYYQEILAFYFTRFFSREYRTLLLPGQNAPIYDPFLTSAVLKMFRDEPHPNIKYIRELNVGEDDNYALPNIWTMLLNKRRKDLTNSMRQIGLVPIRAFSMDPMMDSIRFSGVEYAVYPKDPDRSEDYRRHDRSKFISEKQIEPTPSRLRMLIDIIAVDDLYGLPNNLVPSIISMDSETYVFSPAFYANTPGQSALELLVQDYMDQKQYSLTMMFDICKTYHNWGLLEQFYQLPFLMAILRSAIRRL